MKLKPFIVFKGAKGEMSKLNEEFRGKCIVASSENGWKNATLTRKWVQKVFSLYKRILAWDECHMEEPIVKDLKAKKIESLISPGGCTKYVQAPDVSWNKPFKTILADEY